MDKKKIVELKKLSNELKPLFIIGKGNIKENLIISIQDYLNSHELVKIKVLTANNKDELKTIVNEVSSKLSAIVIDIRGYTFTLFKKMEK